MKFQTRRRAIVGGAVTLTGLTASTMAATQTNAQPATSTTTSHSAGRFSNKVVLVTGGTSGIGRATVEAFAAEGAKVTFCGRREQLGEEIRASVRAKGGHALYIRADVLKPNDVQTFVQKTIDTYGRIDIAFNNAGVSTQGKVHETSEEEWDRVVDTNLKGVWLSMKYEIPQMLKQKSGIIINNSSVQGFATRPGGSPYAATKAGIMSLTRSAALEYGTSGIRVIAIAPGIIDTPLFRRYSEQAKTPEGLAQISENIGGLKRIATSSAVARAVMLLSSDEASYITGSSHFIDGGLLAGF
ncbi:SDR family NAD(P)-dependent oxidoreductase [Scytonema sp. NUACC26]|uniref:SDR family NAD(P)-dependent oxidoreductase n=1 Tax=Scytonema sp. NUACC26 TaxID=3140176 RepID=UPI0034DCC071